MARYELRLKVAWSTKGEIGGIVHHACVLSFWHHITQIYQSGCEGRAGFEEVIEEKFEMFIRVYTKKHSAPF